VKFLVVFCTFCMEYFFVWGIVGLAGVSMDFGFLKVLEKLFRVNRYKVFIS
jgi:hypothetical protein